MSDPKLFIEALEILVKRVKDEGYGVDEVMQILEDNNAVALDELRMIVEDLWQKVD